MFFYFLASCVPHVLRHSSALSGLKGNYILNMTGCHRSTDLTSKSSDLTSQGSCICRVSAGNAARKRREFFTTERIVYVFSHYYIIMYPRGVSNSRDNAPPSANTAGSARQEHHEQPLCVERLHAPIKEGVIFHTRTPTWEDPRDQADGPLECEQPTTW